MTVRTDRREEAVAFAAKLDALLAEQGLSRRELARRLSAADKISFETARTNVFRMLRGDHSPTETTRNAVADALGIDRAELREAALSGDPFPESRRGLAADRGGERATGARRKAA